MGEIIGESAPDLEILTTTPDAILDDLREIAHGKASERPEGLLFRLGLARDGRLTELGESLFRARWVLDRKADVREGLRTSLWPLLPIQAINQELRGFGAVPESGAMELLAYHRAIPANLSEAELRRFLLWANDLGLLVYSRRDKTVRAAPLDAEAAGIGEDRRLAGVVAPRTPLSNVVRLRKVIRSLRGVAWWADPHFGRRAFEDLVEELQYGEVVEIRILSGDDATVTGERAKSDFLRFAQETAQHGTTASWRRDPARDWHDRFLADGQSVYNMPPVNTLYKGDYSEIVPAVSRPPFDEWWDRSISLT